MASIAGSQRSMRPSSILDGSFLAGAATGVAAQATALNAAAISKLEAEALPEIFNMEIPFVSCLKR
jgi:hypothetical protein